MNEITKKEYVRPESAIIAEFGAELNFMALGTTGDAKGTTWENDTKSSTWEDTPGTAQW